MPDSELAVVSVDSFAAPILIERAGPSTRKLDCRRTIRLTLSERQVSRMTELLKLLSESPATPTAGPRNSMTGAGRRFCSRTWRGFGTETATPSDRVLNVNVIPE